MREFFHGWRRKAGSVALLMACALMAAWLRSGIRYDFIDLNIPDTTYRIGTHGGHVRFIKLGPAISQQFVGWYWDPGNVGWGWESGDLGQLLPYQPGQSRDPWVGYDVDWRWDFYKFHAGAGQQHGQKSWTTFCSIPYWSIVLPLTLLSAYLILHKPRNMAHRNA